jgi:hypothetical protein
MMADKKVDRYRPERSLDATQQLKSALSDTGVAKMVDGTHDKGKSALFDKFRGREERWRREQSVHDREANEMAESLLRHGTSKPTEAGEVKGPDEGGAK